MRQLATTAAIAIIVAITAFDPTPAQANDDRSSWSHSQTWADGSFIPIHATLTKDGEVLTFGRAGARHGNGPGGWNGGVTYDIWNPGGGHTTLANNTNINIFCSIQLNLPSDGSVAIFGGTRPNSGTVGQADITRYSSSDQLTTDPTRLLRDRWYATAVTLPSGQIYIQGGRATKAGEDDAYDNNTGQPDPSDGRFHPELWSPSGSVLLDHLDTSGLDWWYPRNFVLPDGRIFGFDGKGIAYFVSFSPGSEELIRAPHLDLPIQGFSVPTGSSELPVGDRTDAPKSYRSATAVMYEPGKIVVFGGDTSATRTIDLTVANPAWKPAGNMHSSKREWVNGTLLPDGRVLATGGSRFDRTADWFKHINKNRLPANRFDPESANNVEYMTEIWDPASGNWERLTSELSRSRLYHSVALLLPDGRVLSAGGGGAGTLDETPAPRSGTDQQILSPQYIGQTRPTIKSVSNAPLAPGRLLETKVQPGTNISRATLVKTGSVTHSFNVEQRYIDLKIIDHNISTGELVMLLPNSGGTVTPGFYLLSVLDGSIPSESKIINIQAGGPHQQYIRGNTVYERAKPDTSWDDNFLPVPSNDAIYNNTGTGTFGALNTFVHPDGRVVQQVVRGNKVFARSRRNGDWTTFRPLGAGTAVYRTGGGGISGLSVHVDPSDGEIVQELIKSHNGKSRVHQRRSSGLRWVRPDGTPILFDGGESVDSAFPGTGTGTVTAINTLVHHGNGKLRQQIIRNNTLWVRDHDGSDWGVFAKKNASSIFDEGSGQYRGFTSQVLTN